MRRRYAHVPAAENPLRPETPKSPWSRRIGFPAPSGHFRIVLFLIGLIGCFCWVFVPSVYWLGSFSSLRSASVFLWFRFWFIGGFCVPFVFSSSAFQWFLRFLFPFVFRFPRWGLCVPFCFPMAGFSFPSSFSLVVVCPPLRSV